MKCAGIDGVHRVSRHGGLSGEHIQLCAEGARRKPNLSGEWTEMQVENHCVMSVSGSSPVGAAYFVGILVF